ncbi:N-acetyltransferase family protein [Streptomyces olivaceoviridis]
MSHASAALRPGQLFAAVDGRVARTRPAVPADHAAVNAMHERCSPESRYRRYQTARLGLTDAEWRSLTGPGRGLSWVTHPAGAPGRIVAATHVLRTSAAGDGELAILVEDSWQSLGLGTSLIRQALREAGRLGMASVHVMTHRDNHRMLSICRSLGALVTHAEGPAVDLTLPLTKEAP